MSNKSQTVSFLTSVFYKEYGPFNLEELALRAKKREFGWDMYVYRLPKDNIWRPARDVPETREILLKYFPLQAGDMGPSGGYVFENDISALIEVSPTDAGYCAWENAEKVCNNFYFNGFNNWRLPSKSELSKSSQFISSQIRQKRGIEQTNELILHWSSEHKGDKAAAVITCIIEDKWEPSSKSAAASGRYINKDGNIIGHEKQLSIKEWHPVRPVRDL